MEAIDKARERGYENITAQANDLVPKDGGHLYSKVSRRTGNESVLALQALLSRLSYLRMLFSAHSITSSYTRYSKVLMCT